jgi:hypothetical protein
MAEHLSAHRLLAVVGPSGSGKSSLVMAGLIPALVGGEADLRWATFEPDVTPQVGLDRALASLGDSNGVLVIDRFEALFLRGAPPAERDAFIIRLLGEAANRRLVLVIRPDCLDECRSSTVLWKTIEHQIVTVAPLTSDQLRTIIGLQAATTRLSFEGDLAETLLRDAAGEPGEMALVQSALLELWKRRHGRFLRTCEYQDFGGIRRTILRRADEVYEQLTAEDQAQFRNIFVRLTRLNEDAGSGGAGRDLRRRVPLADLIPVDTDPIETKAIVHRMADAGLVVVS